MTRDVGATLDLPGPRAGLKVEWWWSCCGTASAGVTTSGRSSSDESRPSNQWVMPLGGLRTLIFAFSVALRSKAVAWVRWAAVPAEAGLKDDISLPWRGRADTGIGGGGGRGRGGAATYDADGFAALSLSLLLERCLEKSLAKSTLWLRCVGRVCGSVCAWTYARGRGGGTRVSLLTKSFFERRSG